MLVPIFRAVILLLIGVNLAQAQTTGTAKLRTLAGKTIEGDLVSITDKEIVMQTKAGPVTTPALQVVDIDIQSNALPSDAKYSDVELTDGSLFHCVQFALKKNQVELKLAGGPQVKLPLATVSYVLNDAQDPKVRAEWQAMLAKRGKSDLLAIKDAEGTVNQLDGTFGEGDDKGTTIDFETTGGTRRAVGLARIHAMSFLRKPDPDAPAAVCKVFDTSKNVLAALKVTVDGKGVTIQSAAGIPVVYPRELLARVDFSQGKLAYLSDLEPIRVVETSNTELVDHYRRDKSLDNGPLRVGREIYAKGLALHAYTELIYDIGAQYKDFKTILGVDPKVGGECPVKVVIEGDGRELLGAEVKRQDNPRPLTIDVKGIKQLRIVVSSTGLLDLGAHLNLADAKVSK
jgi:hypothetical protein